MDINQEGGSLELYDKKTSEQFEDVNRVVGANAFAGEGSQRFCPSLVLELPISLPPQSDP